jgi:phasin family protein
LETGQLLFYLIFIGVIYMLTVEQVLATNKANIDTLMGFSSKAFEGVEKMVELNLAASKTVLAETGENTKSLLSVKDAQELMALQSSLLKPLAEKAAAYSRHLFEIASGSGAELSKSFEGQAAEAQKSFLGLVDSASKNAPAGAEPAVALMKSAVTAATNAMESVQKAVKQATETAETSFKTATETVVEAEKSSAKKR